MKLAGRVLAKRSVRAGAGVAESRPHPPVPRPGDDSKQLSTTPADPQGGQKGWLAACDVPLSEKATQVGGGQFQMMEPTCPPSRLPWVPNAWPCQGS
ncbi:hypothetical protein NDU88_007369 [Pleurodeles waltl]|uniref:Uncharacterized protein n=1 Tax=Pleurodeles waltl TaxID=8319 RepID=A0AAV7VPI2_PLEWA|nr:hypothetical protein NDU88_007369 [Pleurodeles waltl]